MDLATTFRSPPSKSLQQIVHNQSRRVVSPSVFYIITVTSYLMRFGALQKKRIKFVLKPVKEFMFIPSQMPSIILHGKMATKEYKRLRI